VDGLPGGPGGAAEDAVACCRPWLEWAAAQIAASLSGEAEASAQLLEALEAILQSAQWRPAAQQMAAVVVAVQSHDRLVQQLAHVAETLGALHEHLGDAGRAVSPEAWRALRATRLRAFSMAQERELFAGIVAGEADAGKADAHSGDEVELFEAASEAEELWA
jgi:hypothetical protein